MVVVGVVLFSGFAFLSGDKLARRMSTLLGQRAEMTVDESSLASCV